MQNRSFLGRILDAVKPVSNDPETVMSVIVKVLPGRNKHPSRCRSFKIDLIGDPRATSLRFKCSRVFQGTFQGYIWDNLHSKSGITAVFVDEEDKEKLSNGEKALGYIKRGRGLATRVEIFPDST